MTKTKQMDISKLKAWFATEKRDLPWRLTTDPYAIWISEVMLQQTQVAVVIPYYLHWMNRFPTIPHLAQASLDEVIKAWEGLGYYSRARHLHEASKYLVENFNGKLPDHEEELKQIKGLGPYTIGAILSFAFHKKKAAVDGNVLRVLTRYYGLEDDISKSATVNQLRNLAESLLPEEEPWIVNEALIELGATVCQKKARCTVCPLQESCVSLEEGKVNNIPVNSKKIKIEYLHRAVAVIRCGNAFLVKRGKKGKIMSDLYEFPFFEIMQGEFSQNHLKREIERNFALQLIKSEVLAEISQAFTRYQVRLYPVLFTCSFPKEIEDHEWLTHSVLKQLAFSSGHRRIFGLLS